MSKTSINAIQRYRLRWMILIALAWTFIDVVSKILFTATGRTPSRIVREITLESMTLRTLCLLCVSLTVSYLLVFRFRGMFRTSSPLKNFLLKAMLLVCFAILGNFLIHTSYTIVIMDYSLPRALGAFWTDVSTTTYLLERTVSWLITFSLTLLVIEINEKYSPGLFFSIIFGSYTNPRRERRIVMFLDLKDSTPTAEKMGTDLYFLFIRDFIYYVSTALLEHGGNIYQYVGDEVVTSWSTSPAMARRVLNALKDAQKEIDTHRPMFMKKYGIVPEFRVGIHEGEVTVGEIGIVKKDLAMSGDTMNTAARVRSACNELGYDVLVSYTFANLLPPDEAGLIRRSVGELDLKGKSQAMELFTYAPQEASRGKARKTNPTATAVL